MADGTAVFEKRLNENSDEPVIPFGTSVKYIPTSKKQVKDLSVWKENVEMSLLRLCTTSGGMVRRLARG